MEGNKICLRHKHCVEVEMSNKVHESRLAALVRWKQLGKFEAAGVVCSANIGVGPLATLST